MPALESRHSEQADKHRLSTVDGTHPTMTIASPAAAADVPTRWLLPLLLCMPMICPGDAMLLLLPGEWKLTGDEPQWFNWLVCGSLRPVSNR